MKIVMSNSKELALIGDENHEPIRQCTTEKVKKKTTKQTTLDDFYYQFPFDSTATYLDQSAKFQYLDTETTSPVPSVMTALKTPSAVKKAQPTKNKKKQRHVEEGEVPSSTRRVPVPLLQWAGSSEIWRNMVAKEEASNHERNPRLFENRGGCLPRMRAILLDWLMEVCEVYKLRRVTYHLSVDYIDRFLTINRKTPKRQIQLIGITCLFMAAKLEEIYPPRLSEFSYVCDGACTDADIKAFELIIVDSLGWAMNPLTASGWLNLYLQIHENAKNVIDQGVHQDINCDFFYPQYSAYEFIRASQIIDLFSLDPGFLRYPYSVIAAAALYFTHGKNIALTVSGLDWEQLKDCVEYMAVFYKVIRDSVDPNLKSIIRFDERIGYHSPNYGALKANLPKMLTSENHSIQTHSVDLNYFEKATLIRLERMGMTVGKSSVEKKPSEDANKTVTQEEDTKIMFELDKEIICMSAPITATVVEEKAEEDNNTTDKNSSIDIFKLDKKAAVTFDDILISLQAKETEKPKPSSSGNQ